VRAGNSFAVTSGYALSFEPLLNATLFSVHVYIHFDEQFPECQVKRFMRLLLLLGLAVVAVGGVRTIYKNRSQNIALIPLPLDAANPNRTKVGALAFLGAWELRSDNGDFGGISALAALRDGRFIGVSDAGAMIGFGLSNDARVDRPFIAALPGAFGKGVGYQDRDSEGIAYDPVSGRIWVSYEYRHAIRRFSPSLARADGLVRPDAMRKWPSNKGAEALVRLTDGRFLVFAEGGDGDGIYPAIAFSGDPVELGTTSFSFQYRPSPGYRITDAAQLPDGRLLLLERRIGLPHGFTAKLLLLDPANILRGATVSGKAIATLAPPLLVDNMEGLALTQEKGRTIVWLISDNNFNAIQRTLLMEFALDLPNKKPEATNAPGFDSL
jgi:hypothetical protein